MKQRLSVKQAVLGDLEWELETTRRLLASIPTEHLAWRPHERSWTLGALAAHTANLLHWQLLILQHDEFDLASSPAPSSAGADSAEALLRQYDERAAALREVVAEIGEDVLSSPWTLRHGSSTIFTKPKALVLRQMGISHMVHHRAQLGVYLRLLNLPVPPSYGPTGDEK